jgi:spore coat protein U-like protein
MKRTGIGGALILLCLASGAQAANCTLNVTDINFGAVMQLNPQPVDVQGSVTVRCQAEAGDLEGLPPTATVDYLLAMNGGMTTNNPAARGMQGPGGVLSYQIYSDSSRQLPWGDGSNGTQPVAGQMLFNAADVLAGTQKSADHISYARLPANINVAPGMYADTVTVTLTF